MEGCLVRITENLMSDCSLDTRLRVTWSEVHCQNQLNETWMCCSYDDLLGQFCHIPVKREGLN